MIKKLLVIMLAVFILMNFAYAVDSSDWKTAEVGGQTFKIPPKYDTNPYKNDSSVYWFDEDNIHVFCVRHITPTLMDLYGYYIENGQFKKVEVAGHDAVHFTSHDRGDDFDYSTLWFSSGEEFYYIQWKGNKITPSIKEIVKSCSPSDYSHKEFYNILNEEYQNDKIVDAIESQRYDYPSNPKGFYSYGSDGFSYGWFY